MINKLNLTNFGRFKDRAIELSDGLNIVYAPNETGKSTIAGFIKFIFYGFPKRERISATNPITTRSRYTPWGGGEPSGSLVFSHGGHTITAVRSASKELTLSDTLTGTPVSVNKELGEELYGVSLDTFESTAFFGQSALAGMSMDEIESKLKNIVTGADESVSYDKAHSSLLMARNKIDNGRGGGALGALRREISDISFQIEKLQAQQSQLAVTIGECEKLERENAQTLTDARKIRAQSESEKTRLELEFNEKCAELDRQTDEAVARRTLLMSRLGTLTREDADRGSEKLNRLRAINDVIEPAREPEKGKSPLWQLILGVLALAGCAVAALAGLGVIGALSGGMTVAAIVGAVVLFAAGVALIALYALGGARAKSEYAQEYARYERMLALKSEAETLTDDLAAVFGAGADYPTLLASLYEDIENLAHEDDAISRLMSEREGMDIEKYMRSSASLATLGRQFADKENEYNDRRVRIAARRAQIEERERAIESADILKSALNEKQERATALTANYGAYLLALDALEKAHLDMTHLYAPMLAQKTAEYFDSVAGDRARTIVMDAGGTVRVCEADVTRSLSFYSVGTADAVYISLRLALIDMLYNDRKPTLVFDDSFANFDEGRAEAMLTLLGRLAESTQIILFTCRDPEPLLKGITHKNIDL